MKISNEELEGLPWLDIIAELVYHAEQRMRRFTWQGRRGGAPPEGWRAEDIAQDAVRRLFDGSREWNRRRYPTVFDMLRAAVDSDIEHRSQSWANRRLRTLSQLDDTQQLQVDAASASGTVEAELLATEADEEEQRTFLRFEQSLEDEPLLVQMVACIRDYTWKRRDMLRRLGIEAAQFDAARRRLQRRWTQFQKSHARGRR